MKKTQKTINNIMKAITITKNHQEWIKKDSINLSRFVQKKIDEEINKNRSKR